jgi:hypothetical protein
MAEGHGRGGACRAGSNHPALGLRQSRPSLSKEGSFWLAFMSSGLGVLSLWDEHPTPGPACSRRAIPSLLPSQVDLQLHAQCWQESCTSPS